MVIDKKYKNYSIRVSCYPLDGRSFWWL